MLFVLSVSAAAPAPAVAAAAAPRGAGGGEECQAEYLGDVAQSQRENSADRFLGIELR